MKLIFGFVLFVVLGAVTGGLYLSLRKADDRKSDLEALSKLPGKIVESVQKGLDYLSKLFGNKQTPAETAAA